MIKEITDLMLEAYERNFFSLTFPKVLDQMYSGDANFETSASNTLQPLRIYYSHNVVTHSVGIIFVNGNAFYDSVSRRKAKVAEALLKTDLSIQEVKTFRDLSKSQIIEKMDLIQCRVDDFERKK